MSGYIGNANGLSAKIYKGFIGVPNDLSDHFDITKTTTTWSLDNSGNLSADSNYTPGKESVILLYAKEACVVSFLPSYHVTNGIFEIYQYSGENLENEDLIYSRTTGESSSTTLEVAVELIEGDCLDIEFRGTQLVDFAILKNFSVNGTILSSEGVARRIRKGYIGDENGVAKLIYDDTGTLKYGGVLADPLPATNTNGAIGGFVGDYGVLLGFFDANNTSAQNSALYNSSLTVQRTRLTAQNMNTFDFASVGDWCVAGPPGNAIVGYSISAYFFDKNLTSKTGSAGNSYYRYCAAAIPGEYAVLAFCNQSPETNNNVVYNTLVFDKSFTLQTINDDFSNGANSYKSNIGQRGSSVVGAKIVKGSGSFDDLYVYSMDKSLTVNQLIHVQIGTSSYNNNSWPGVSVASLLDSNTVIIIADQRAYGNPTICYARALNESGTITTIPYPNQYCAKKGVSLGSYAIFPSASNNPNQYPATIYDSHFTVQSSPNTTHTQPNRGATVKGKYAIFDYLHYCEAIELD